MMDVMEKIMRHSERGLLAMLVAAVVGVIMYTTTLDVEQD